MAGPHPGGSDLDPGENGRALSSTDLALFSAKNGGIEPALSQS